MISRFAATLACCVVTLGYCGAVRAAPAPPDRLTTFASQETGTIRLTSFGGNVPSPWGHVTKVYLTLSRRGDLGVFTRLSHQHRLIASAMLREVGAYSYEMRHVEVSGWYVEASPRDTAHVTLSVETWIPQNPPTPR